MTGTLIICQVNGGGGGGGRRTLSIKEAEKLKALWNTKQHLKTSNSIVLNNLKS